jgi:hypothetical protein
VLGTPSRVGPPSVATGDFTEPALNASRPLPDVAARRFWIARKPETHLFSTEACSIALSWGSIANAKLTREP